MLPPHWEDVTAKLLADISAPGSTVRCGNRRAILTYKTAHKDRARWTATQELVFNKIPADGWHMGYVSRALGYAHVVDRLPTRERQALHGLMAAGHVRVYFVPEGTDEEDARRDSPFGYMTHHYRIVRSSVE